MMRKSLTELEGAALTVINRFGSCTPYRVRLDFQSSRSHEWSGSAGAVYPALRRMHEAGLLRAEVNNSGRRRSIEYSLSPAGRNALARWLGDVERACGSGLDPFRCRSDYWRTLPPAERRAVTKELVVLLKRKCAEIEKLLGEPDMPEPNALALELALHKTRLRWLKEN